MNYARISDALQELVFDRTQDVDLVLDKYFSSGYVHRNSGNVRVREEFAEMARMARSEIAEGTVVVLDELRSGSSYAERHTLDVVKHDGSRERAEIYIVGTYAPDGRFATLNEAGFPITD